MPVTEDRSAPYAPPSVIIDIVSRYRNRGLPFPVNAEVLARAGVSESLIPRTLQSLQTLDLIKDNGNPTETLEGLRLVPEGEYKPRLAAWLKSTYAGIFAFFDPTKDDEVRIRDAFRGYRPIGQQDRMVILFEGLCTAAGLIAEKPAQARPASTSNFSPQQRAAARRFVRERVKLPAASATPSGLPAALAGLLAGLPAEGTGWTKPKRDLFVTTFGSVLDYCFPILEHEPEEDEEATVEATEVPIKRHRVI